MKIKCRIGTSSSIINVTKNFLLRDIALHHFTSKSINVDLDEYCFKIPHYDYFLELDQTVNDLLSVAWVFSDKEKEKMEDDIVASIVLIRKLERGDRLQREQLIIDPTIEASCAGYLWKRGGSLGNFATFKKRYFILQSNTMFYQEMPGQPILGFIPTSGISIKLRPDVEYKNKIAFELVTLSGARNYILCADQSDFISLQQAIDDLQLRRCKALVVALAEELLRRDVSQMQGVFRISGQKDHVEWLKYQFELSECPDLSEIASEVLTSVIKLQLRSLESPAIPFGLYSEYLRLGKMPTNSNERLDFAQQCVSKLMPSHRSFLHYLFSFLKKIAVHQGTNLMNEKNLAIVIGPNILRSQRETTQTVMNDNQYVLAAVQYLIEEVDAIFGPTGSLLAPDHEQLSQTILRERRSTIMTNPNSYVNQQQNQQQQMQQQMQHRGRASRMSVSEIDPSLSFVQDLRTAVTASRDLGTKIDRLKQQHDAVMGKWNELIGAIKQNPQNSMNLSQFILSQSEMDTRFVDDGLSQLDEIYNNLNDLVVLLAPTQQQPPQPPQANNNNLPSPKAPLVSPRAPGQPPPPPPGGPNMPPSLNTAYSGVSSHSGGFTPFNPAQPPTPRNNPSNNSVPLPPPPTTRPPGPPPAMLKREDATKNLPIPPPPATPPQSHFDDFSNDQYSEASEEEEQAPPPPPSESSSRYPY